MAIFGEASSAAIAGFVLVLVSFVLQLIGLATPFWIYVSSNGIKAYSGLWQVCGSESGQHQCKTITCKSDDGCPKAFKGAQAAAVLGFLVLLAAVVCVVLKMFVLRDKQIIRYAAACCCFLGGVLALVGAIVYATMDGIPTSDLHFSFAFCIIAGVGGLLAGVLLIVGK